jgi:hypothetical protein
MKSKLLVLVVAIVAVAGIQFASTSAEELSAFDRIKSLAGDWEGKGPKGTFQVSYKVISNGAAVMESMNAGGHDNMVTMYYRDGSSIMLTHFCMADNQPRMKTSNSMGADNTLRFAFVDATNVASPSAGHMHQLVLGIPDAEHITQEWTWMENGKPEVEKFTLERKH